MGMHLSLYDDDDDCFYIVLASAVEQTLRSHVILHEWLAFYSAFLNIHQSVVLTALAWLSYIYIYISPSFYLTDLLASKIFSVIMVISERGVTIYLQYSTPSCPKEFSNSSFIWIGSEGWAPRNVNSDRQVGRQTLRQSFLFTGWIV